MTETKSIFQSRTIWTNLIGLAALVAHVAGVETSAADTNALADAATQLVAAGSFIASTVFRVVATRRIAA
jgi:hypothetical protein